MFGLGYVVALVAAAAAAGRIAMSAGHALDSRGRRRETPPSAVHALDPRAKLAGLFGVTVVAVSAPIDAWPVWVACAAVLLGWLPSRASRPA